MIHKPIITSTKAAEMIEEGMTLFVGGFLGVGSPKGLIAALEESGKGRFTLVCSDTGILETKTGRTTGVASLVAHHQCKRVIASHIGTNPETQKQMFEGEIAVELVPQGTLAERIRAAGVGLGGVLTPTGVGTEVATGKQSVEVSGKPFLLELPLKGDVALINAKRADRAGNLQFAKTARNFNPLMATACDVVIAEVEEIVEVGEMDPDQIHTPSIFVHYLVQAQR